MINESTYEALGKQILKSCFEVHKNIGPRLLESVYEVCMVEQLLSGHEVQLVTYLKLADKKLGYLINFNVSLMKEGIRRKVNNYYF